MAATKAMREAVEFFVEQAGYSYGPGETPEQGRLRGARQLAKAEAWLAAQPGHQVSWEEDDCPDRSGIEHDEPLFCCDVRLADGRQESLCGIDLGESASLANPYTRVVVAELALELMD